GPGTGLLVRQFGPVCPPRGVEHDRLARGGDPSRVSRVVGPRSLGVPRGLRRPPDRPGGAVLPAGAAYQRPGPRPPDLARVVRAHRPVSNRHRVDEPAAVRVGPGHDRAGGAAPGSGGVAPPRTCGV
ncbi:MAG: hypothetical protein AVDCRST_MAG11-3788, partial [uncultured Gemmatimonadaceae bacterium]